MTVQNTQANPAHHYDFDPSYGYNIAQLLQVTPPHEPHDFIDFWQTRYQKTLAQDPLAQISDTGRSQSHWRIFSLRYTSTDQFPISGWLLIPQSGVINRGFIIGHGYGGRESPDFHLPFDDAVLMFPCFRGLSLSQRAPISNNPYWHVRHDIDKLNRYILGGCVEDVWMATSAMLQLFPQLHHKLGYLGISFSGGIGALAMACENRIARCHFNVPSFGHHPLRMQLATLGSADSLQQAFHHEKMDFMQTLSYYDAAIAAKHIKMPTHCACAVFDPIVAPPGQFAIYNALPNKKQLFVLEAGHADYPSKSKQENDLLTELKNFFLR